jgi:hypothetical protein
MTPRALPRSRLASLIPTLLEARALVAIVPTSSDAGWAARAAWDVARAAAAGSRRVALVDLGLEHPSLQEAAGLAPSEGIVDAFERDVSLTEAAEEVDGVFFIAAGAASADPDAVFGSERWKKLQRGFQSEGALLLVFLAPADLRRLSAVPDGLLVLSPEGFEPGSPNHEDVAAALERGAPLLGVVRERWTPGPMPAVQDRVIASRGRRSLARALAVGVVLVAGAAGGWQLLAKAADHSRAVPVVSPTAPAPAPAPAEAALVHTDTLAWTIQVAAFGTLPAALDVADRLATKGPTALVTPVSSGRGTVWYRVLAGFYPTRDAAVAARNTLWERGSLARGEGDLLLAPYSLELAPTTDVGTLRTLGVPAVRLPSDGRTLVGAFESPEQAALAETRLRRAGVRTTLVTRTGTSHGEGHASS